MGERMHPAVLTEVVFGDLLVELIEVQIILAPHQPEPVARHANEHPALLGTNRAIAPIELRYFGVHFEFDRSAVAAPMIFPHSRFSKAEPVSRSAPRRPAPLLECAAPARRMIP
jgi:hypothetical protein